MMNEDKFLKTILGLANEAKTISYSYDSKTEEGKKLEKIAATLEKLTRYIESKNLTAEDVIKTDKFSTITKKYLLLAFDQEDIIEAMLETKLISNK